MSWDGRDWWVVTAWLASLAVVRAATFEEPDPYWQVRAGTENLDGAALVRPDSWSWAPVDGDFAQTSPAWNTVLGGAWDALGGFPGLFLVGLVSIGAYLLVATLLAHRLGARPFPTLAGLLVVLLPALPMLSPRATVVAQTLFLAAVLAADVWRAGRTRPLALDAAVVGLGTFAVVAAGSWLHLSWVLFAPAVVVCCAVLWLTAGTPLRRSGARTLAGVVGAAAGILAGPYGLDALAYSQAVQEACEGLITEWLTPFTPGLAGRWVPVALLAIVVAGVATVVTARRLLATRTDPRASLTAALLVLAAPAALGGLLAVRFLGVSLLAVAPVVAAGATALAGRAAARAGAAEPTGAFRSARVRFWSDGTHWRPVLVAVVVLLLPGTLLLGARLARPLAEQPALDALPAGCRLFSDPGSAAAVVLTRPDVPVWVDGRADYWGHDRLALAAAALAATTLDTAPLPDATCVVLDLDNGRTPLVAALDASPDWDVVAPGRYRTWVRR